MKRWLILFVPILLLPTHAALNLDDSWQNGWDTVAQFREIPFGGRQLLALGPGSDAYVARDCELTLYPNAADPVRGDAACRHVWSGCRLTLLAAPNDDVYSICPVSVHITDVRRLTPELDMLWETRLGLYVSSSFETVNGSYISLGRDSISREWAATHGPNATTPRDALTPFAPSHAVATPDGGFVRSYHGLVQRVLPDWATRTWSTQLGLDPLASAVGDGVVALGSHVTGTIRNAAFVTVLDLESGEHVRTLELRPFDVKHSLRPARDVTAHMKGLAYTSSGDLLVVLDVRDDVVTWWGASLSRSAYPVILKIAPDGQTIAKYKFEALDGGHWVDNDYYTDRVVIRDDGRYGMIMTKKPGAERLLMTGRIPG